ncbi:farnesyl cysteine-carboxyl methyltransferase, mediates the carboxyl methylation step during C-termin [Wallemia mellicola]|uniref:Protein-S-isoprenylcysteine O-methyltransferase n=1 Tax=Wallemia mellicola TaxID=1708541 RepID=A0A4T0PAA1_9BASI|nr:hypothetical protein E3Q24_00659 [Wallemia mellicola]TIB81452.1 farnesyl cysteine-carboxyl methyltransferase, mediates the carboxyl methylation step during C-termin [Wallemia mellicola]TIC07355.1 farnesyl cysteine-carboxyl methyltransferase, mediates the carboxyl methylation step during C-termin [Wallemia mellicola]TIC19855.1 farnesyl cysteine-carboxyl methyltransferase, mediates the carboxyl methylation step during C-termin [Wallemia mellicola]TIC69498.1 farnesyl cysteine-carboxyl methyltra
MSAKIPSTALYANQIESPPRLNGSLTNSAFSISLIAFTLGAVFGLSLLPGLSVINLDLSAIIPTALHSTQVSLYLVILCWFHLWEFLSTAGWNMTKTSVDSYLLNNGYSYTAAHAFGLVSHYLLILFYPSISQNHYLIISGLALVVVGQVLRTLAMVHASESFSHHVASFKQKDHKLVTNGVYRIVRHPSYLGFYLWALGTQMILTNPLSFIAFAIILHRFFTDRIKHILLILADEETYLVKFFGNDYQSYKNNVYSFFPYII